jgi:hypothetical protein
MVISDGAVQTDIPWADPPACEIGNAAATRKFVGVGFPAAPGATTSEHNKEQRSTNREVTPINPFAAVSTTLSLVHARTTKKAGQSSLLTPQAQPFAA